MAMRFDPDVCYSALLAGDQQFDGRFFAGVVTTGVYCRSVCPVPQPAKQANVRLFSCQAAAEVEGFRPCRVCHPENAATLPTWTDLPPVLSRAMRLIDDGALDRDGIESLAARLGLASRHLRRLFVEHLGAPPIAIAKARRTHFARRLLDETNLPISDIAFTAGFRSIRSFNDDIARTFGRNPRELRAARGRRKQPAAGVSLKMPYRPPLDWARAIAWMQHRAIQGVEVIEHDVYRRTISVGGSVGTMSIHPTPSEPHLILQVSLPAQVPLIGVVDRARRVFDLGADPLAIADALGRDRILGRTVRARPGMRVPGAWDPFEVAVRAVLGQQISVRAATTLTARLVRSFGKPLDQQSEGLTHLFPSPEVLADADIGSIGTTKAVAGTIRGIAAAVIDGDLRFDGSLPLEDFVEHFTSLPGVGPWTAQYVAMRGLGDPDAFPSSDLVLRKAMGNGSPMPARDLERISEAWRPWRSYAAMYLWQRAVR